MKRLLAVFLLSLFWLGLCLGSAFSQDMLASYYGAESGTRTASGARFNPEGMTAAHRTLPFGTVLRVTYRGRSVDVVVSDRGPYSGRRSLDLSHGAARRVGLVGPGVALVSVEVLR